jgi:epoxyqueuosine reductase
MDAEALTGELRRCSREQGFDACAVATAERLDRDRARLDAWLGRDLHAGMRWMAREPAQRADPRALLPGCRSVILMAMNYWPGEQAARVPRPRARVALYARGRDYHKVFSRKLKALATWLDETAGSASRTFVDTGPVLERAWAERAGLGWIAKNANLLTRELGSWLLLGEVLTTAALVADPGPHAEFCGNCTACLDACPTSAIVEEGVVDANRCVAYWTIEHRGPVPAERRAGMGDWIFGCDVCQEVCPWNEAFALPAEDDPFARRDDLRGLDPAEILAMDEATFRARYSGTSLMRAKWEGMRRNACIVLGNRALESDLAALAAVLDDPDPVVAGHAAWAIAEIGSGDARRLLEQSAAREARPPVLAEIRQGLARGRRGEKRED